MKNERVTTLTEARKLIQEQAKKIEQLEEENIAFPFRLYHALEAILDHDPIYQLVQPEEINVCDFQFEITRKIKLLPKDIVCILSEELGRKKTIYALEENLDGELELNKYTFNQAGDLEKWARFFDRLAHRLIKVSKSAAANVAFYQLANDNCLHLRFKLSELPQVETIKISNKKSIYDTFKSDFLKIQTVYRNHILLQKKTLGYMNLIDAIVSGKFTSHVKKDQVMSKKKTPMTKEAAAKIQSIAAKKPESKTVKSEFAKRAQSSADKKQ